jgi:hypothetical protein
LREAAGRAADGGVEADGERREKAARVFGTHALRLVFETRDRVSAHGWAPARLLTAPLYNPRMYLLNELF